MSAFVGGVGNQHKCLAQMCMVLQLHRTIAQTALLVICMPYTLPTPTPARQKGKKKKTDSEMLVRFLSCYRQYRHDLPGTQKGILL